MVRSVPVVAATLACLVAGSALAADRDPAAADALFRQAQGDVAAGRYEQACPRFAESYKLDPAPGTLLNLANCEEHQRQLASALEHFRRALDVLPRGDDRIPFASNRIAELQPLVPQLTLRLREGARATVVRDGVEMGAASLGVPLPVNPGTHTVIVRAAGRSDRSYTVELHEHETKQLDVEAGEPLAGAAAGETGHEPPRKANATRTLGWAALGVGAAGLGVGAVTGLLALSAASSVRDQCPNHVCTDSSVLDTASRGKTFALVSTIGFGFGIAGAAVGTFLLLRPAPKESATVGVAPVVGPGTVGVSLGGGFR